MEPFVIDCHTHTRDHTYIYIYTLFLYVRQSVPRVYLLSILATYTGVVGSIRVGMSKPLLLPEPYGGEAGGWAEWVDHFENVAAVNKWGHW